VTPHRLRHSFAMATLERLVGGYYQQAAQLAAGTGGDAALRLYLAKADPLMVLRDLLGHSSVRTTEHYLSQGSGIASGGRETAGRKVSVGWIETSACCSRGFVTRDYATAVPSDARSNHQEGKISDRPVCRFRETYAPQSS